LRLFALIAWYLIALALAFDCCLARSEDEPLITFGIEQELRAPLMWQTVAPVAVPLARLFGYGDGTAKRLDAVAQVYQRTLLRKYQAYAHRHPEMLKVEGDHVTFPGLNFGFKVTVDFTVLELPTDPFTVESLKAAADRIQLFVFDIPRSLGLKPANFFRASHVHIGLSAFRNDPLKYLNFIIDFVNHGELSGDMFLYDPVNAAPPVQKLSERAAFKQILQDFDDGKLQTVEEIRDRLLPLGFDKVRGGTQGALNLKTKFPTIEFRSNAPFESAKHMIEMMELFQSRIRFLDKRTTRLEYKDTGPLMSRQQMVDQFYLYVTEPGLDWGRFGKLMPTNLRYFRPEPANAFPHNPRDDSFGQSCWLMFSRLRSLFY
jgi:hypothetical protein